MRYDNWSYARAQSRNVTGMAGAGPGSQSSIVPGYSPITMAQQTTPYLRTPGAQGLTEGAAGGQGTSWTPSQQFYARGGQGSAAPSSVPNPGSQWSVFGGSGDAPSSFAQGGFMSIPQVAAALGGGTGSNTGNMGQAMALAG